MASSLGARVPTRRPAAASKLRSPHAPALSGIRRSRNLRPYDHTKGSIDTDRDFRSVGRLQVWRDHAIRRRSRGQAEAVRASLMTGLYVLPLDPAAQESLAGQRVTDLAALVDYIATMAYHAILQQPPERAERIVRQTVGATPQQTLPVAQVDSRDGPSLGVDWGPPGPAGRMGRRAGTRPARSGRLRMCRVPWKCAGL